MPEDDRPPITLENIDTAELAPASTMGRRFTFTESEQRAIIKRYLQGAKIDQITRDSGASRSSIYNLLQRNNVEPQRMGSRRHRMTEDEVRQLTEHLEQRIDTLEAENTSLRRQLALAEALIVQLGGPSLELDGAT